MSHQLPGLVVELEKKLLRLLIVVFISMLRLSKLKLYVTFTSTSTNSEFSNVVNFPL